MLEHQNDKKHASDREKLLKKREDKTKQLLSKAKKDLGDVKEEMKEKDKQISGFMKAAEAFDVQTKR